LLSVVQTVGIIVAALASAYARMSGSSWNFDGGPLGLTVRR
jgi:hypothetical protein